MATSVLAIFEPRVTLKRKRNFSNEPEEIDSEDDRIVKKSIQKKSRSTVYAQLPTPDDSEDDEEAKTERNVWYQRRALVKKLSICSMNSVQVNLDDLNDDSDMCLTPALIEAKSILVASSPRRHHQLTLLAAVPVPFEERLPTPTTTLTIDTALRSITRRSWHSQRYTTLSPLTGEEAGLLSPTMPLDSESLMILDSASDSLKGLNVYCDDDSTHMEDTSDQHSTSGDSCGQSDCSRTARLHMGFRADCEKCTKKVPGHYSHIIWS